MLFKSTTLGLRMRARPCLRPRGLFITGVGSGLASSPWAGHWRAWPDLSAGLLTWRKRSSFGPYFMDLNLIYAFTAAVIGGLESPVGALVGGLITGLSIWARGWLLGVGPRTPRRGPYC